VSHFQVASCANEKLVLAFATRLEFDVHLEFGFAEAIWLSTREHFLTPSIWVNELRFGKSLVRPEFTV
jgi:hypothetical protein